VASRVIALGATKPRLRERLLHLSFLLGVAAFFWAFVGGFVYLLSTDGVLPLRTDPLRGARQRGSRGDVAGALRQYRIAARIDSNDVRTLNEMGELLARNGQYERALAAFDQVLEARADGRALAGIGDVLMAQRRYPEAGEAYERSLGLAPNRPAVLNHLGMARSFEGDLDRAILAFAASDALLPHSEAAQNLERARAEKRLRER
jgi:tetratricopeptide (TPR) repeat protein